jgi:hypothetical protein
MRLWRLTRVPFSAPDGSVPEQHCARYSLPGKPVVNFASEPGFAVAPLATRPFSFSECLHAPPMLGRYGRKGE